MLMLSDIKEMNAHAIKIDGYDKAIIFCCCAVC